MCQSIYTIFSAPNSHKTKNNDKDSELRFYTTDTVSKISVSKNRVDLYCTPESFPLPSYFFHIEMVNFYLVSSYFFYRE